MVKVYSRNCCKIRENCEMIENVNELNEMKEWLPKYVISFFS